MLFRSLVAFHTALFGRRDLGIESPLFFRLRFFLFGRTVYQEDDPREYQEEERIDGELHIPALLLESQRPVAWESQLFFNPLDIYFHRMGCLN